MRTSIVPLSLRTCASAALTVAMTGLLAACGPDKPATVVPDAEVSPDPPIGAEPEVPQEPDPPQLAEARRQYLLGHYAQVASDLQPLYSDLRDRKQYRAGGLAGGWLALAHAYDVVEQAEAPSKHAVAMAERTADPEVTSVAKMAYGAYLMGIEDFEAAVAAFNAAAEAAGKTSNGALARILRAEALIGRAFGAGGGNSVKSPADLDAARKSYELALTLAASGDDAEILQGRAHEGLAAIAKYKGESDKICAHATQAQTLYGKVGASDFLAEGPQMLARDGRCPQ